MNMFSSFFGLPLHPLVVHAAVVFIPLLILGLLVYAVVPAWRPRIGWAVALLAVIAPLSAALAKLSGDAFRARIVDRRLASPEILGKIDTHRHFGTITLYLSIALGAVALAAVLLSVLRPSPRREPVLTVALVVLAVALGGANGYYVFRTGDTAAHIVWQGY